MPAAVERELYGLPSTVTFPSGRMVALRRVPLYFLCNSRGGLKSPALIRSASSTLAPSAPGDFCRFLGLFVFVTIAEGPKGQWEIHISATPP